MSDFSNLHRSNPPEGATGIVISVRDNIKFFKLAFHSVMSFTNDPYMLTVVDNMSSFSTRSYLGMARKNHPINLMPYHQEFNYGAQVNVAMNFMFSFKTVKYGLALNSDVVVEPNWLKNMIRLLESDEKIGIVGPVTNIAIPAQQMPKAPIIQKVDYVSGFCMLFKRKVFEDVGGFDEDYVGGCYEDEDFCLRAKQKGWQSMVCGSTYVHHFWRATRNLDPHADQKVIDNRRRFFNKFPNLTDGENESKEKELCQSQTT